MPSNQDQHKIPQVYLKKFGYIDKNNQWRVSVISPGGKFTNQKSIESFTALANIFDIDSIEPRISRVFEKLNCSLETEYNNIINELDNEGKLSEKSYVYLLHIIANLMIRSDFWRDRILAIVRSTNKDNFLRIILGHHCRDYSEFKKIKEQSFFKVLIDNRPEEAINRILIYFIDHLMLRLEHYEIAIIQSQFDKPWFTSTNPVVSHNRKGDNEIFAKESEIYFPISPKYLAYVRYKGSNDKENELRNYESNKIYLATNEQNVNLLKIIMDNPSEFLIIAGEFKYERHI